MSQSWWNLAFATTTPMKAAAASSSSSTLPEASGSKQAASTNSSKDLARTAFHANMEALLLESTKHRSLVVLRDAIQQVQQKNYDAIFVFKTLLLACNLLAEQCCVMTIASASAGKKDANGLAQGTPAAASISSAPPSAVAAGRTTAVSRSPQETSITPPLPPLAPFSSFSVSASSTYTTTMKYAQGPLRMLLAQCLNDLNKMITLGLLPLSLETMTAVTDMVRQVGLKPLDGDTKGKRRNGNIFQRAARAATARMGTAVATNSGVGASTPPAEEGPDVSMPSLFGLTPPSAAAGGGGPKDGLLEPSELMINDEEMLLRLVQLTASLASSCPLESAALADLYGLLLLFYIGAENGSMLEATCTATLTHHTHRMLSLLREESGLGDSAEGMSLTAMLHAATYVKDICRIVMDTPVSWIWLNVEAPPSSTKHLPSSTPASVHRTQAKAARSSSLMMVRPEDDGPAAGAVSSALLPAALSVERSGLSPDVDPALAVAPFDGAKSSSVRGGAPLSAREQSLTLEMGEGGRTGGASRPSQPRVPMRLRLLLVQIFTSFFGEERQGQTKCVSSTSLNPLFVQCLNDCVGSVAAWGLEKVGLSWPTPPSLLQELHHRRRGGDPLDRDDGGDRNVAAESFVPLHAAGLASPTSNSIGLTGSASASRRESSRASRENCSVELFAATQRLALTAFGRYLPVMEGTAQQLLHGHRQLFKEAVQLLHLHQPADAVSEGAEGLPRTVSEQQMDALLVLNAVVVVLELWRRITASTTLTLSLLLSSARSTAPSARHRDHRSMRAPSPSSPTVPSSPMAECLLSVLELVRARLSNASGEQANTIQINVWETAQAAHLEALSFLVVVGQSLVQAAGEERRIASSSFSSPPLSHSLHSRAGREESPEGSGRRTAMEVSIRDVFRLLHAPLFASVERCVAFLYHEEDAMHVVLKLTSHCVHLACLLGLEVERDAYLGLMTTTVTAPDAVVEVLSHLAAAGDTPPWLARESQNTSASAAQQDKNKMNQRNPLHREDGGDNELRRLVQLQEQIDRETPLFVLRPLLGVDGPAQKAAEEASTKRRWWGRGEGGGRVPPPLQPSPRVIGEELGWASPAVQDVLVDAVCRLRGRILIFKCVHLMASSLGGLLTNGWVHVARCLSKVEIVLAELTIALKWVAYRNASEKQQHEELAAELAGDATQLREATRLMWVDNACRLAGECYDRFLASSAGLEGPPSALSKAGSVPLGALAQQQCLVESICLSLMALIPFIEGTDEEVGGEKNEKQRRYAGMDLHFLQRQRASAASRALRLWEVLAAAMEPLSEARHLRRWCPSNARSQQSTARQRVLEEQMADVETTLTTVASHVAVVAVQMGRSAHRCRSGEAGQLPSPAVSAANDYATLQVSLLALKTGPFANTGLTVVANRIFSLVAMSGSRGSSDATWVATLEAEGISPSLPVLPYVITEEVLGLHSPSFSWSSVEGESVFSSLLAKPFELLELLHSQWNFGVGVDGSPPHGERDGEEGEEADAPSVCSTPLEDCLHTAALVALSETVKVVQGYGEDLRGPAWVSYLKLLRNVALPQSPSVAPAIGNASSTSASSMGYSLAFTAPSFAMMGAAAPPLLSPAALAQAVEALNIAFRALENVQHNHITSLPPEGLLQLILCAGAFAVHRLEGRTERRLHVHLSAVQVLWSVADYLATYEVPPQSGVVDAAAAAQEQRDTHWCALLWQLKHACLDDRQEVRQSAQQTLLALAQNYGSGFSGVCWQCVLRDVMAVLFDTITVATEQCVKETKAGTASTSPPPPSEGSLRAHPSPADGRYEALTRAFMAAPSQLEDMRVTVIDAAGRLFVLHYGCMQDALLSLREKGRSGPSPTGTSGRDEARLVLESFLRLCGQVTTVLPGTSGERSAVAVVHALHGMMVEMSGTGLHAEGIDLAWAALERLVAPRPAPSSSSAATAKEQSTVAVVAAVVAALCDNFRHQRSTATASASIPKPSRTLFSGAAQNLSSPAPSQYFVRLLMALKESAVCSAVVTSYYFPCKPQTTMVDGLTAIWPLLTVREAHMVWGELLLPAFPSLEQVHSFVLQDPRDGDGDALTSLKALLPPASHPSYCLLLLDFMRGVLVDTTPRPNAAEEEGDAEKAGGAEVLLAEMARGSIAAVGALLVLQAAPPAVMTIPATGTPFTIEAASFYTHCFSVLSDLLWKSALVLTPTVSGAQRHHWLGCTSLLCEVLQTLLVSATLVDRRARRDTAPTETSNPSNSATRLTTVETTKKKNLPSMALERVGAVQLLEKLVVCVSDVLRWAVEDADDRPCARRIITALSTASSTEGAAALGGLDKRCLAVLQRWTEEPAADGANADRALVVSQTASLPFQGTKTTVGSVGGGAAAPLGETVRRSILARHVSVMRQFRAAPQEASVIALLQETLADIRDVARRTQRRDAGQLSALLPELVRLVATTNEQEVRTAEEVQQERVLRQRLTMAMLDICEVLGFREGEVEEETAASVASSQRDAETDII